MEVSEGQGEEEEEKEEEVEERGNKKRILFLKLERRGWRWTKRKEEYIWGERGRRWVGGRNREEEKNGEEEKMGKYLKKGKGNEVNAYAVNKWVVLTAALNAEFPKVSDA